MAARKSTRTRPTAVGYLRVSTEEQRDKGASLAAQRAALTEEARRRGWDLELIADEGVSGATMTKRPGLLQALARLDRGEADVLLATRLDRVSRSVADFSGLMERGTRRGWQLRLLSPDIDTTTPEGRLTAHILAAMAEFERQLISSRTREGMAQRKREGVRMGRPVRLDPETEARIRAERAAGRTLQAIADDLNREGVPTAAGGRWYPSTIKNVAERAA